MDLAEIARRVADRAYAPYSGYHVGCAILTNAGNIFDGCNVENVSFGATLCAERVALGKMVSAGERTLSQILVWTQDASPPCGVCLQALSEFISQETVVTMVGPERPSTTVPFRDLLPYAFQSNQVERTE